MNSIKRIYANAQFPPIKDNEPKVAIYLRLAREAMIAERLGNPTFHVHANTDIANYLGISDVRWSDEGALDKHMQASVRSMTGVEAILFEAHLEAFRQKGRYASPSNTLPPPSAYYNVAKLETERDIRKIDAAAKNSRGGPRQY